jgi:hypothetical protein
VYIDHLSVRAQGRPRLLNEQLCSNAPLAILSVDVRTISESPSFLNSNFSPVKQSLGSSSPREAPTPCLRPHSTATCRPAENYAATTRFRTRQNVASTVPVPDNRKGTIFSGNYTRAAVGSPIASWIRGDGNSVVASLCGQRLQCLGSHNLLATEVPSMYPIVTNEV